MLLLSKSVDLFFGILLSNKTYRKSLFKAAVNHELRNSRYGRIALSRLNIYMSKHHFTHSEFMEVAGSDNYQRAFWQSDLGYVWFNNSIHNENLYFKYAIKNIEDSHLETVLDVGCGWGEFCARTSALPHVSKVLGIDISEKIIEEAKKRFTNNNLFFQVHQVDEIKEHFDIVTVFGAIDYIYPDKIESFLEKVLSISTKQIIMVSSLRGIDFEQARLIEKPIEVKRYDIGYVQPLYQFFHKKGLKNIHFEKMGQDSQLIHIVK